MAFLVLQMPACKMAQKSHGCPDCQYRSCHGLAERNVRLYLSGAITEQRLAELSQDLAQTCPWPAATSPGSFSTGTSCPLGATVA